MIAAAVGTMIRKTAPGSAAYCTPMLLFWGSGLS